MSSDKVSLRDVYDAVNRVEDKMDKRLTAVEDDVEDLQAFQNRALGIASIFAALVSAVTTFIWNKLTNTSA